MKPLKATTANAVINTLFAFSATAHARYGNVFKRIRPSSRYV